MSTCIPKEIFGKDGFQDIFKITDSLQREKKLGEFLDAKLAKEINNKFEKTKLLKKTDIGYNKFIDDLQGVNDIKKAEMKSNMRLELDRKAKLLDELQEIGEMKSGEIIEFEKLADDIYKKKHNLSITDTQSAEVVRLTNLLSESSKLPKLPNGDYQDIYGQSLSNLNKYIDNVKDPTREMTLGKQFKYNKDKFNTELAEIKDPFQKAGYVAKEGLNMIFSPAWKTMKATLDASFIGIQGTAFATRNPEKFVESTKKAFQAFTDSGMIEAFRIKTFADKDYKKMIMGGLRVLTPEEQWGATIMEKLPFLGKAVKASDDAFSLFLQNSRVGEFKRVLRNTEKKLGRELDINVAEDLKTIKELAAHANKVTGTSNLGSAEKYSGLINQGFFAGRYAVSDIRNFTDMLNPALSKAARIRSVETLGLNLGSLYGAYLTYAMLHPDETEINPNNANFMKIKVGDNIWVGPKLKSQWLIQMIAKIAQGEEVSARGVKTVYGEGYKPKTGGDVILRTIRGKAAPVPAVLTDLLVGKDFSGEDITLIGEVLNLASPISAGNIIERIIKNDQDLSEQLILGFTDATGFSGYQLGNK